MIRPFLVSYDIAFVPACLILYNFCMTDEEIRQELRNKKKRQRTRKRVISAVLAVAVFAAAGWYAGSALGSRKYDDEIKQFTSVVEDKPLINTAMSQLGNVGGEPYWTWFGFGMRVEWCAIFVSWCEDQCGYIKNDKAPSFAMVEDGAAWFKNHGQWLGEESAPEAGDLVFFDWNLDGEPNHVGIVTAVTDDLLFTVEGNSNDRCRQKRYSLSDPVIYGYARIPE